jgi:signal transduction histidine kinase/ligand-binding sensor domain-containing protein/DNA-binding response OmpR family regulator
LIRHLQTLLFSITFLSILSNQSVAQKFTTIDISSGLSNNSINCIEQDKRGLIWFGTYDGLCMYDGQNFTTLRHDPQQPYSICDNFITSLVAADNGLWVGTRSGLGFLSFDDQNFYKCSYETENGTLKNIDGFIRNIVRSNSTIVALSASEGILLSKNNRTFSAFNFGLPDASWMMIASYKSNTIIAHNNAGIYILNPSKQSIENKLLYNINQPIDHIYYSKKLDKIFIGSGIKQKTRIFREHNESIYELDEQAPSNVKSVIEFNLSSKGKHEILFGTDGNGLITIGDKEKKVFTPENSSISSDAISTLFPDNEGNLWIGTFRGGVNLYSTKNNWFQVLSKENSKLGHNVVTSIVKSPEGEFYMGTDGGGMSILTTNNGDVKNLTTANSNLSGNNVLSTVSDGRYVWLGIYGSGLSKFDSQTKTSTNYDLPNIDNSTTNRNLVWVIKDDNRGNIWVGGKTGIFCFNKSKGTFDIIQSRVREVSEISFSNNSIWVSTNGNGLFELDYLGNILRSFTVDTYPQMANNNLHYVLADTSNVVWFGTEHNGLCKLNLINNQIQVFGKDNGLDNLNIVGMLKDQENNLWISTFNGLYRFDISTETFISFGKNDLPTSPQFNYNACYSSNGIFYFGSTNGLLYFEPAQIKFSHQFKKIIFTDFKLMDSENTNLLHSGSEGMVIKLPFTQNFFTISFAVPELISPDKIRYSYYLENFEKNWHSPSQKRQVNYTNVPPGKYRFIVRATNPNGEWNQTYSTLDIIITPPWWKTTWATALFILAGISILICAFLFYRHELKMKHTVQLKEIESNTTKNIHEAKLSFFSNVSHELRTPIFLIKAPLEELLSTNTKSIQVSKSNLLTIYKNANRLHKLINRIIDFRKLETGKLNLELRQANVVPFCKDLITDYDTLCNQKKILLLFVPNKTEIFLPFDEDKLESILSNLLTNAYKYTPIGGKITLSITDRENDVVFAVEDNGIGIPKEHLSLIFEQFYQVSREENGALGDGIGLSFVKALVEMHGGEVSVESVLKKGSAFSFTIPKKPIISIVQTTLEPSILGNDNKNLLLAERRPVNAGMSNPVASNTLLIIDDEIDVQSLMEQVFGDEFRVLKANNGYEGLQMALDYTPDLIICDIMMPRMSGVEFLAELKANQLTKQIPVIMLTAKSGEEEMLKAFGTGAAAFLPKPVSLNFLKERVHQLLDKSQTETTSGFLPRHGRNYTVEEKKFITTCKTFVEDNIDNTNFSVQDFAQHMGMSHSTLYKKLKQLTGYSIIEFTNTYRIHKSIQYFKQGETNISQVSIKCGFNDPKNFRVLFKQYVGLTPTQFLQST